MAAPNFKDAFLFPLKTPESRRDLVLGGLILSIPIWGWIANLGHRIVYTHRMIHAEDPFPAWSNFGTITRHGLWTFLGMVFYHLPAAACFILAPLAESMVPGALAPLVALGVVLWALASVLLPGFMTEYCRQFRAREIFRPVAAARRVLSAGPDYWKAWLIVLTAGILSFAGLLAFGIGFLFTSVWFWQVAAYCFATVFTQGAIRWTVDPTAPRPTPQTA
ncbi:MAG: DUF4013 domain-containing protein [Phycisphaerales bacterium]|nr:DUF4013 domain-containing protein [Phycisphaerales bacterium]